MWFGHSGFLFVTEIPYLCSALIVKKQECRHGPSPQAGEVYDQLAVGVEEGKSESEDVHMFTNTVAPFTFTQTVGI